MRMNTFVKFAFSLLFFMAACDTGTLDFNVTYNTINGLKNGNPVVHNGKRIGVVKKVVYTDDGDYLVAVSIDKNYAALPTDTCLFFIAADPKDDQQRAIEMFLNENGNPIKSGQTITGATSFEAAFRQLQGKFNKEMTKFFEGLTRAWEDVLKAPDSPQLHEFEKEIDQFLQELGRLSGDAKKKLETEIIPNILKQFEELRKKLKGQGHDEELKAIHNKLKKITLAI